MWFQPMGTAGICELIGCGSSMCPATGACRIESKFYMFIHNPAEFNFKNSCAHCFHKKKKNNKRGLSEFFMAGRMW